MARPPGKFIDNPPAGSVMSQSVNVRRAKASDALVIEALYRELVPSSPVSVLPEQVAKLESSATSYLLVAESSSDVLGVLLLTICPDAMYHCQPFALLENLVVSKISRGRGIGTHLVAEAQRIARELDCSKMLLLSNAHRTDAHRFFSSQGFLGDTKRGFVKYRSQFNNP